MSGLLTGADAISGSRLSFQEANNIKNCYRGAAAPADATDDRLYQYDGAAWNLLTPHSVANWTPAITFGGAAVDVTYDAAATLARYVRLGDWVTISGRILLTDKGSSNGAALITPLPFTCKNYAGSYASIQATLNVISFANQFACHIIPNSDDISIMEQTEAGVQTAISDANFANTSEIIFGGSYEIEV